MTETSTIIRYFVKVSYGEAFSQGVADLFRKLYWIWRTGLCLTCHVNILKPKQNCRHFEDDIFTSVFITEKCCILINFTEVCVNGSNWLYVSIGLAKESAQWKRQSITCTTSHIDWITPMMLRPVWYLIIILLYNILQANNPTHEWKFLFKKSFSAFMACSQNSTQIVLHLLYLYWATGQQIFTKSNSDCFGSRKYIGGMANNYIYGFLPI